MRSSLIRGGGVGVELNSTEVRKERFKEFEIS